MTRRDLRRGPYFKLYRAYLKNSKHGVRLTPEDIEELLMFDTAIFERARADYNNDLDPDGDDN